MFQFKIATKMNKTKRPFCKKKKFLLLRITNLNETNGRKFILFLYFLIISKQEVDNNKIKHVF